MHYPHKVSRIKKLRKQGFRTRMRTSRGRKLLNRQRRKGKHSLSVMS
ncbi:MAG: 50S ribosomal protein L34 [Planctomycetota bacterium]